MELFKRKNTTAADLKKWLEALFKKNEMVLSEHAVPETENTWVTQNGEIPFYIKIDTTDPEVEYIIFHSILCEMPTDQFLPFYRKCLELNANLFNAALTVDETSIFFFQKAGIKYLCEEELEEMISYHLTVAELVLKDLAEEFDVVPNTIS